MEFLTQYTKVDPVGRVTVSADKISFVSFVPVAGTVVVYSIKGAGYFSGNFKHTFRSKFTKVQGAFWMALGMWYLSNTTDDARGPVFDGSPHQPVLFFGGDSSVNLSDGVTQDLTTATTLGINYYYTVYYDKSVGAHGTLYAAIFTDAARTALFDLISVALDQDVTYPIFMCFATTNVNYPAGYMDGEIGDYELNPDVLSIRGRGMSLTSRKLSLGIS